MLPLILDEANKAGIEFNMYSTGKKEVRTKCPFCKADANRSEKFYLSLNATKNAFKCWFCQEGGGVIKFIALLQGTSEDEVKKQIFKGQERPKPKAHPAERLKKEQLQEIGLTPPKYQKDYLSYRRELDHTYKRWQEHQHQEKRDAYSLFYGLETKQAKIDMVREYAKRASLNSEEVMAEFVEAMFAHQKPSWAVDGEGLAYFFNHIDPQEFLEMAIGYLQEISNHYKEIEQEKKLMENYYKKLLERQYKKIS